MKEQASPPSELKYACDQKQQPSILIIPPEAYGMHNSDPLYTSIIGGANESTHSLPMGKTGLGYADGSSSSKFQTTPSTYDKLGIFSTPPNPTPQLQSVEGGNWVVL